MSRGAKTAEDRVRELASAAVTHAAAKQAPVPQVYPFAYALVEGPPGQWTAVCLAGVTARTVEKLEPNGDAEPMFRASQRIQRAMEMRTIGKRWSK
jgi:hypothetical protein